MKSFLVGAAFGAAAVYLIRRSKEDGGLDKMCDEVKDYASQVKKTAKDAWDKGVNKAEYVKERAEDKAEAVKKNVNEATQ